MEETVNFILKITIRIIVFCYLKSKFHFDDGTINAIIEFGITCLDSLNSQLTSLESRNKERH